MEGLKRQIKYQLLDTKKAFIIFWAIMIAVDILIYIVNIYFGATIGVIHYNAAENITYVSVTGSNIVSIFVFVIVYNMIMYYESFPISIGFSTTRGDFYTGVIIHNTILCLVMAVIQTILFKIEVLVIRISGMELWSQFMYFDIVRNNVFYIAIMLFIIFVLSSALFNLLGTLSYRYGYKMWIVLGVLFILSMSISPVREWIGEGLLLIFTRSNSFVIFVKLSLIAALLYAAAWMIIRRMSIRNVKVSL